MEAYYDMENNPQEKLCDKLWEIIIQAVLTEFRKVGTWFTAAVFRKTGRVMR